MKIGYARVSTMDQNLDRQIDALTKAGCKKIFSEKASGKSKNRPELQRMLEYMRSGDQVVVTKLDRIGRNTKNLIELSEQFESKGVDFISLGDSIDTSTATGRLFFSVLAAIAQFEADLNRERTLEGLAAAKRRGNTGGRPKKDSEMVDRAIKMYNAKTFTVREISQATGLSKSSIYRYANKRSSPNTVTL